MNNRNLSLDALRGLAILGMVLSGSIAYGPVLPAWMFHAQVPPPHHKFIPSLPGITWVDLVFPFFLFSMGAALPLSLQKKLVTTHPLLTIWAIVKRFLLLAWLAFYFEHVQVHLLSNAYPPSLKWANALAGFVVLWGVFNSFSSKKVPWLWPAVQVLALVLSAAQVWVLQYEDGKPFNLGRVDIIILVLANMALFGSICWWATRYQPLLRLGVLAFVMAIFLSAKIDGSWQSWLFHLTPSNQIYQFYFLKYLFIVLPGTLAGEWLASAKKQEIGSLPQAQARTIAATVVLLLVCNLVFLLGRMLELNLFVNLILGISLLQMAKQSQYQVLIKWGIFWIWLGLTFEAYEGGIKKDFSTYSYYFVCSGLGYLLLVALSIPGNAKTIALGVVGLAKIGQNPLVAYVAGGLVVLPILGFTRLLPLWNAMNQNAAMGLLKGLTFTAAVACITLWFTHKKWFWKS